MEKPDTIKNSAPVQAKPVFPAKKKTQSLGKDEFLKILVTQLSHQDPLQPMQDREFIAQMAQFSALEQMISMNNSMSKMNNTSELNRAFFFLGKTVRVADLKTQAVITGKVSEIDLSNPREVGVKVNNKVYKLEQVVGITTDEGKLQSTDTKEEKPNLSER